MKMKAERAMKSDTIAAISSGMTVSGLIVIRVSGPDAVTVAERVFRAKKPLSEAETHTVHHGFIEKDGVAADEVLVSLMKAPHGYTGEDVVEISCHGGPFVAEKVLSLLFEAGARPAEPGEFTKRAFLNGKMDLSKAESVIGVITAGNEFALRAGVDGLKGRIGNEIRVLREKLLDEVAKIEAALDDPEHYDLSDDKERLGEVLAGAEKEAEALLARSESGTVLREGIRTVIAGRPNAGKSSLLNLVAGAEKSIVTEIPGTTRDVVEDTVSFGGLTLLLADTAGLRETSDPVEKIGVEKANRAAENADLILYLADAREGITAEDRAILSAFPEEKVILLRNKADLVTEADGETAQRSGAGARSLSDGILFSCKTGEGLETLKKAVYERFVTGKISFNDEVILTSRRQIGDLKDAIDSIRGAREGIRRGDSEEFISADLTAAYAALGRIIGEAVGEDVIDRVFEKFCMGK